MHTRRSPDVGIQVTQGVHDASRDPDLVDWIRQAAQRARRVVSVCYGAFLAAEVLRNPVVTMSVVEGAGHSPHRDRPEAAVAAVLHALR